MGSHDSAVQCHVLDNGLQVLLREDHAAPLASFWVFYRVGSRNELPGMTGASHWVEHMQFKGTPTIAKGQIFRDVSRNGGTLNALTSNDWTAYFETLPVDRLDLSLAIESDRMVNSLFDLDETEAERTVILSERQGSENNPGYLLYEEVVGAAFRAHPYRHMVIGHEPDLRSMTRADLFDHYRRFYIPNNAFIVVVGDFHSDELLRRIEDRFGGIPAGDMPVGGVAPEPSQRAERRVHLRHPAATAYVRMAYHAPAAVHPDLPALLIADAVLSGGKGMGLAGGGPMGRSSRLYRALVSGGLARSAGSDIGLHLDPHLFGFGATCLPDVEPQRVEDAFDAEIRRLQSELVPEYELQRAAKQVKAQYVYSAEGVTNQAFWLGQMEIVDSWRRVDALVPELERVTAEQVRGAAQTWLRPDRRTVGWLTPSADGGGAHPPDQPTRFWRLWGLGGPGGGASRRAPFERHELGNGIVVLGQAQPDDPSVSVRIRLQAGSIRDPEGKDGLAVLTARALLRGAGNRTYAGINDLSDALGASIGIDAGKLHVEASIRCLREDLGAMVRLAADVFRRPAFPRDEVENVRQELLTGIREADQDTRSTADRAMRRLLYPAPHPLGRRSSGDETTVSAVARDDVEAFHHTAYGPEGMVVAAVGGFEHVDDVAATMDTAFGDWRSAAIRQPDPEPAPARTGASETTTTIRGKRQADIAIGLATIPRSHPDFYGLDIANLILGRLGLMGRLGADVRDRQGLAYYAFSGLEAAREGSIWAARAGVDPANEERAKEAIIEALRRVVAEPVSDEELADAKSYSTGVLPLALETNDGVATTLLGIEHHRLGLDFLDRYPAIIAALTTEDVLRAVRNHLDPDAVAIGVAGPA
jgi:zinc protease